MTRFLEDLQPRIRDLLYHLAGHGHIRDEIVPADDDQCGDLDLLQVRTQVKGGGLLFVEDPQRCNPDQGVFCPFGHGH
jgi:hypothetical protein